MGGVYQRHRKLPQSSVSCGQGQRAHMYIYVMGRAHSGSTILDILLGNAAASESLGELVAAAGKQKGPRLRRNSGASSP